MFTRGYLILEKGFINESTAALRIWASRKIKLQTMSFGSMDTRNEAQN